MQKSDFSPAGARAASRLGGSCGVRPRRPTFASAPACPVQPWFWFPSPSWLSLSGNEDCVRSLPIPEDSGETNQQRSARAEDGLRISSQHSFHSLGTGTALPSDLHVTIHQFTVMSSRHQQVSSLKGE